MSLGFKRLISSGGQAKGTVLRLGCCVAVTNSNVQQTACKILHWFSNFRR